MARRAARLLAPSAASRARASPSCASCSSPRARGGDERAFRRKLTVIRRRVELAAAARRVPEATFHIASFSSSTLTYKGLLTAPQLARLLRRPARARDRDRDGARALALLDQHARLLGSRAPVPLPRAQRRDQHRARQHAVDARARAAAALGAARRRPAQAVPADRRALERLRRARRGVRAARARRARARARARDADPGRLEPGHADGRTTCARSTSSTPACSSRGTGPPRSRSATAARPAPRSTATACAPAATRSRATACSCSRPRPACSTSTRPRSSSTTACAPGQMLIVDTDAGPHPRRRRDQARARAPPPLPRAARRAEDLPRGHPLAAGRAARPGGARARPARSSATRGEELRDIVAPMARDGQEPLASMGVDTPLAALSKRPRLLRGFFKQLFAQVTNPAIDPQRETLVMSLRTAVGAQGQPARRVARPRAAPRDGAAGAHERRPGEAARAAARPLPHGHARLHVRRRAAAAARSSARSTRSAGAPRARSRWARRSSCSPIAPPAPADAAPIPALLATAAVHSHLVREGWRTKCGLIVESGEPREVMDFALLVGFGAAAVNPYVALDLVAAQWAAGEVGCRERRGGAGALRPGGRQGPAQGALEDGRLDRACRYRGAQLFECVGLSADVVARYFTGTPRASAASGSSRSRPTSCAASEHALARRRARPGRHLRLPPARASATSGTPRSSRRCSAPCATSAPRATRRFAAAADEENRLGGALRGLLELVPAGAARAARGGRAARARSCGASRPARCRSARSRKEAHETLAIALNRLGGRSNSGEGGEDARRSQPDAERRLAALGDQAGGLRALRRDHGLPGATPTCCRSRSRRAPSPARAASCPGHKVDVEIARLRHSTPGVGLISPPPHHDIYSIEDLAQLIHDLRCVNPTARDQRQAGRRSPASARSPPASPRPAPTTS